MKKIVYTTLVALLLVACSKDDTGSGTGGGGESGGVTEVTPLRLDGQPHYRQGSCYRPGESVSLQLTPFLPELKSATGQWTRLYRSRLLPVLLGLGLLRNRLYRLSGGCVPYEREWNRGYSWYYCRRCIQ